MATLYETLIQSGFMPFIIVVFALIVERVLPWPEKYHPLTLFRLIATNLALKVNPSKPRSAAQRRISGSLSIIVLLLPMLAIFVFYSFIAQFPLLIDALLLLVALQFQPVLRQFKWTQKSIKQQKKSLARQHLSQIVLRETHNLSLIGMGKAAIESLVMRFLYQQFALIIFFLMFGGLATLTARLLFEMHQCWNTKLLKNRDFGLPIKMLCNLVYFLPSLFYGFFFSMAYGFIGAFKALKNRPQTLLPRDYLKLVIAGSMGLQLGGPAIYQNQKIRMPKVGATREVRFDDMSRALVAIYQTLFILLVTIFVIISI